MSMYRNKTNRAITVRRVADFHDHCERYVVVDDNGFKVVYEEDVFVRTFEPIPKQYIVEPRNVKRGERYLMDGKVWTASQDMECGRSVIVKEL